MHGAALVAVELQVELTIRVAPNDATKLACDAEQVVDGLRCEHEVGKDKSAKPPSDVLVPLLTKEDVSLLAADLWSQPIIQDKLAQGEKQPSFNLKCKMEMAGTMDNAKINWGTDSWMEIKSWPVVRVKSSPPPLTTLEASPAPEPLASSDSLSGVLK